MTDPTTEAQGEQGQAVKPYGIDHDPPNECLFCGGPKHPKETDCPDYPHYLKFNVQPTRHCTEVMELEARIAELEAENKSLRSQLPIKTEWIDIELPTDT